MQFDFSNFKQNLLETSGINKYKSMYDKARNINIGPYRSYDLKVFEIRPSEDVDNKNNHIILDSFANLALDNSSWKSIWQPVLHGRDPIGLEVFSDGVQTSFHILLPPDHTDFMVRKIYGVFQGSKITPLKGVEDYMLRFNSNRISDIYHIDLKDHPVMPYRMDLSPIGNSVVEALEVLEPGELACIQILLQPLVYDWQSKYKWAYYNYKQTNKLPPFGANPARYIVYYLEGILRLLKSLLLLRGGRATMDYDEAYIHRIQGLNFESDLDKAVRQKLQSQGFRTSIKITVQSQNPDKRSMVSRTLSSSITNLSRYNSFLVKKYLKTKSDTALEDFKNRAITRDSFVSCSHEASNLISLADSSAKATLLNKAFPKEEPVSNVVSEGSVIIGNTLEYQGKMMPVSMASKSFNEVHRTTVVMAPPGYGKTTMLKSIAIGRYKIGSGFLAADIADGEMAINVMKSAYKINPEKIVYLDFTDENRIPSLSLSMIKGSSETRAEFFAEWFQQMMNLSTNAPRARVYLQKYALSCMSIKDFGLTEFKLLLEGDRGTIDTMLKELRTVNPALFYWWSKRYASDSEAILKELEPIRYRLENMFENNILRWAFSSNTSNLDIEKLVNEGYGICINLSAGKVSKRVQQTIMSFFFLVIWSVALSREKIIQKGLEPRSFSLLLDEPYTYIHMTETIEEAVNKFRKYGIALNIFMHGSDQIIKESKELWEEIMISDPNLILGFASEKTRNTVRSHFTISNDDYNNLFSMVKNRNDHMFIAKMTFDKGSIQPFVFKSIKMDDVNIHSDVLNRVKYKYAPMTTDDIDKKFFAKLFKMTPEQYTQSLKEAEKVGEAKWVSKEKEEVKEIPSGI